MTAAVNIWTAWFIIKMIADLRVVVTAHLLSIYRSFLETYLTTHKEKVMNRAIESYLRWFNLIIDEDRDEMQVERHLHGGLKVSNSDGEVLLDASLNGTEWRVVGDDRFYEMYFPLQTRTTWDEKTNNTFRMVEDTIRRLN